MIKRKIVTNILKSDFWPSFGALILRALVFIYLPIGIHPVSRAEYAIIPPAYSATPGEGAQLPFGNGSRYQSVYSASDLLSVLPEGGIITSVGLRVDESVGRETIGTLTDLEVKMGTTPSLMPIITVRFEANIGSDYRTVFPRQTVSYQTRIGNEQTHPFNLQLALSEPFHYDPRKGGLIIDFLQFGGGPSGLLIDAGGGFGLDGAAHLQVGSPVPALVLQLGFISVPEPSILVVFSLGILVFTLHWRQKA